MKNIVFLLLGISIMVQCTKTDEPIAPFQLNMPEKEWKNRLDSLFEYETIYDGRMDSAGDKKFIKMYAKKLLEGDTVIVSYEVNPSGYLWGNLRGVNVAYYDTAQVLVNNFYRKDTAMWDTMQMNRARIVNAVVDYCKNIWGKPDFVHLNLNFARDTSFPVYNFDYPDTLFFQKFIDKADKAYNEENDNKRPTGDMLDTALETVIMIVPDNIEIIWKQDSLTSKLIVSPPVTHAYQGDSSLFYKTCRLEYKIPDYKQSVDQIKDSLIKSYKLNEAFKIKMDIDFERKGYYDRNYEKWRIIFDPEYFIRKDFAENRKIKAIQYNIVVEDQFQSELLRLDNQTIEFEKPWQFEIRNNPYWRLEDMNNIYDLRVKNKMYLTEYTYADYPMHRLGKNYFEGEIPAPIVKYEKIKTLRPNIRINAIITAIAYENGDVRK
ncbi:MAG: hypothetical protein ACQES1_11630 [Bacteroidota bacterium]